jgi:hypothetical protein
VVDVLLADREGSLGLRTLHGDLYLCTVRADGGVHEVHPRRVGDDHAAEVSAVAGAGRSEVPAAPSESPCRTAVR